MTILSQIRAGVLPARFTIADLDRLEAQGLLDPEEKFELIDGEIVPMPPKSSAHERFKSALVEHLVLNRPKRLAVWVQPSIVFDAGTYLDPDIVLFDRAIESRDARGPDLMLVIEVAATSYEYDTRRKAALYARYGVRDYWVVDVRRKAVVVHREAVDDGYRDIAEFATGDRVETLLIPGLSLCLGDLV